MMLSVDFVNNFSMMIVLVVVTFIGQQYPSQQSKKHLKKNLIN